LTKVALGVRVKTKTLILYPKGKTPGIISLEMEILGNSIV